MYLNTDIERIKIIDGVKNKQALTKPRDLNFKYLDGWINQESYITTVKALA